MAKVLVVIHNRSELRRIGKSLQAIGFTVLLATDGLSGFAKFQQEKPDAVVINLLIPKLTGGELCKKIKTDAAGADTPVILLSGLFKKTDMAEVALQHWKADRYLQAPFKIGDLIGALQELTADIVEKQPEPIAEKKPAEPEEQKSTTSASPPPKEPEEDSLEDLLAKTVAELEKAPLIDRSPKMAQIEEDISAEAEARGKGEADKIDELLGEIADKALGDSGSAMIAEAMSPEEPDQPQEEGAVPLEGDLAEVSVPELFAALFLEERTGILEINHQGMVKNVYFDQGRAVYVDSEGRQESLGQILVQQGIISDNDLLTSLENMTAFGRRQGEALIEMGKLNPMQLYQALRHQMREKLLSLFTWMEGGYFFDSTPFDVNTVTVFELPMPALIYDGVVDFYDAESLKEMFEEVVDQMVEPTVPLPFDRRSSGLGPEVWKLHELIDGKRTLAEIVAASPLGEAKTWPALYAMLVLHLFDRHRDEEEEIATAPVSEETITVFEEAEDVLNDDLIIEEEPEPQPEQLTPIDESVSAEPEPALDIPEYEEASEEELAEKMAGDLERELQAFEAVESGEDDAELQRIDHEKQQAPELEQQILALYLKLEDANHYEILEIPRDAKDLAVDYAYQEKKRRFSPNKIEMIQDPEVKEKAEAVLKAVKNAYTVLSSPMKRSEYDRRLTPEGDELKERRITTILAAERAFNQGVLAMRRGAIAQAETHFKEACDLFPEEAEYHAYLGWAQYNNPKLHEQKRIVLAKEAIEKSLKINSKGDKAHYFLGKLLLAHGNKEKARKMFALALRYNKNNEDAKGELHRLQQEVEKQRKELKELEDKDKLGNVLKKDIDFHNVKKAIKKLFW